MERYCDVEANGLINEDYEFDQAINIWIDLIDQKHSWSIHLYGAGQVKGTIS